MNKLTANVIVASVLPLLYTMPVQADGEVSSKLIAKQYFDNNSIYDINSGWTLLPDAYDFATLIGTGELARRDAKKQFVTDDGYLLFDARWTRKTLKLMYPDTFPAAINKNLTGDDRKEAVVARNQEIKALREQACPVTIEVGTAVTYGVDDEGYQGNVTELDTDAGYCTNVDDNTLGTVALRSFIPTVPGAQYSVKVEYRQRDYNWQARGALSEAQAYRDLILRFGSEVRQLPLSIDEAQQEGATLDQGFIVATSTFTAADRFFTPLNLRDSGHPDEFGILIRSVEVTQLNHDEEKENTCNSYYPAYSKGLKNCLTSEVEPELYGCTLEGGDAGAKLTWKKGDNSSGADYRSIAKNVFHNENDRTFLSLGKGGSLTIQLRENNVPAVCSVAGKTLALDEVTWGNNTTYENYAEKAVVKVKFVGCTDSSENGWRLLTDDESGDINFVTKVNFSHQFPSDSSCAITAIKIKDRTHKINSTQAGYIGNSDGIDINNLRLTANE